MTNRALTALVCALASASGGCGDGDVVVGISWAEHESERWTVRDGPAIAAAVEAAGGTTIETDAEWDSSQQSADIADLVDRGADAIVVIPTDGTEILPAVQDALEAGIPVIAYDRLLEDDETLYLTFDNVEVGRMQARAVFEAAPTGNYVFIMGDQADPNADLVRSGQDEILQAAIDGGAIHVVGDTYTTYWEPATAQASMEDFLVDNANDVDAAVVSNDGMAGGVIAALEDQGLAGLVPVSGQDGDGDALNRVALGTQVVTVWKDARVLGETAGAAAVALADGTALPDLPDVSTFESPDGNTLQSVLLDPVAITQDNLDVLLDAGWISEDELCAGVPTGTVEACP